MDYAEPKNDKSSAPKRNTIAFQEEKLVASDGRRYLVAEFPSLRRGDCTVTDGEFRFYEDGSTSWRCTISSTDTGDEWDGMFSAGLNGYDGSAGTTRLLLLYVASSYHFDIRDANIVKDWFQEKPSQQTMYANGSSAQDAFNRAKEVVFYCGC